MSQNKQVLIATNSHDKPNYGSVAQHLKKHKLDVILYTPDSIARGEKDFSVRLSPNGSLTLHYHDRPFHPETMAAAWYRRPEYYGAHQNKLRWLSIEAAFLALQDNIWAIVPEERWLNAPQKICQADIKLIQLKAAAKIGFAIPETVVSNSWNEVEKLQHNQLIFKAVEHLTIYSDTTTKVHTLPTAVLARNALPKQVLPYPGLWQPYLAKSKEWRITVVGERAFSASIYTEPHAKDDWRKHQFGKGVTFKHEAFPESLIKKCKKLLQHFGLRYGAFDFVETPKGEIFFLEVNPNGKFMWLEEQLGLPISEAIAEELLRISQNAY